MFVFAPLQQRLAAYLSYAEVKEVARAYLFAADAHEAQFRSSGEPYVTHTVATAIILADMHLDSETIMAALMHDVIEDTAITFQQIEAKFGLKVAELVDGVSKLTQIYFESKQEAQAENFRKMMLAMIADIRIILIKIADRLHNMRTIDGLPIEKRQRIARETLEIYAPIAHRLGIYHIKMMLEDLSFKALYPWRYQILKDAIHKSYGHRQKLFEKIERALTIGLEKFGLKAEQIFGRSKTLYSTYCKMKDRGVPFPEIMDMYAFRIIAKNTFDCYHILGAVHSVFKPIPGKFKDYIAIPKANGYQSLHTVLFGPFAVPIEIQIRTRMMDQIAENGIAAHWLYKTPGDANQDLVDFQAKEWLQKVREIQASSASSLDFIRDIKVDLFPDEVYVFTPKGEILCLPRGSSALDFAYAVHTEVGNHCKEIYVNKRNVPLSYPLLNGQTVEVQTDAKILPDSSWLHVVVTGKARAAIRHALKELQETRLLIHESLPGLGKQKKPVWVIHSSKGMNLDLAHCCHPIPGDSIRAVMNSAHKVVVHVSDCEHLQELIKKKKHGKWTEVTWSQQISGFFQVKVHVSAQDNVGVIAGISREIAELGGNIREFLMHQSLTNEVEMIMIVEVHNRIHLAKIIRHIRRLTYVKKVARGLK